MSDDPKLYRVGHRKPPLHTRFAKGASGNPSGRPKGSRNLSAIIAKALSERVTVNEGGRRRSITKLDAAVKQMANKAAGGDPKSAKLILELLHQAEVRDDHRATQTPLTREERQASDRAILDAIRSRKLTVEQENEHD